MFLNAYWCVWLEELRFSRCSLFSFSGRASPLLFSFTATPLLTFSLVSLLVVSCALAYMSIIKWITFLNYWNVYNFSLYIDYIKINFFITLSPTWWKSDSRIILGVLAFNCPLYDVARTCKSWRWPRSSSLTFSTFRSRIWESFAKTGKCGNILINIIKEFLICT